MDVKRIRRDFPVLGRKIDGKPLVYLDSACVALKPQAVIDAINDYYTNFPGCGGRSVHKISTQVTCACEDAREKLRRFINAHSEKEIVITRNTTEAINIVARGLGLKKGETVLTTDKEHNSNLVPWHQMSKIAGIRHYVVKSNPDNTFNLEAFKRMFSGRKVRLVSFYHSSNLDGYTLPAKEIIEIAHDRGALVMLDAAQSAPHKKLDAKELDVDFMAFSIHKMCGPSGMGVLYGKHELLHDLTPTDVGGETVSNTSYADSTLLPPPQRFEGGLQDYAGIIGAGAAVDYVSRIGMDNIAAHEVELNQRMTNALKDIREISVIGPRDPRLRGGIYSFNIRGMEPHDVAMILDEVANIMIRSGMLCVHSWFNSRKVKGTARASAYFYNTKEEIDLFAENVRKIVADFCK